MEHLKIIHDKENKLLGFREVSASAHFPKTPTSLDIAAAFAEKYKSSADACIVKKIKGSFGTKNFSIIVRIYSDKASMDKIEKKNKKPKKKIDAGGGK